MKKLLKIPRSLFKKTLSVKPISSMKLVQLTGKRKAPYFTAVTRENKPEADNAFGFCSFTPLFPSLVRFHV